MVPRGHPLLERQLGKAVYLFKYDSSIRKLIYTTHAVEGYHRQIRKATTAVAAKTKGAFTSDMAFLKLIYLVSNKIEEKWTGLDSASTKLDNHYSAARHLFLKAGCH